MNSLEARFDAVQEQILSLYEKGSTDLADHVKYWELIRAEGALEYCARQSGRNKLGLHSVPSSVGAESKAKKAIHMQMVLSSLQDSSFGSEPWTMADTSLEMYERTSPEYTFKKKGSEAEVTFGSDPDNSVSYMVWGCVYTQDEDGQWHKHMSVVDYYGVYYVDHSGVRVYYHQFDEDSKTFGGDFWTVRYKLQTFTSSPDSTTKENEQGLDEPCHKRRRSSPCSTETIRTPNRRARPSERPQPTSGRRGRLGQGERTPEGTRPSPEEIGRRPEGSERSCQRRVPNPVHCDPPVILLKGPTNTLKCWRNRLRRRHFRPFIKISTAFSWVEDRDSGGVTNMLVAFLDSQQRDVFLKTVPIPKGSVYYKGNFEGL
ncbi:E2 [Mastomys coucha papillomavirus 2]|uniref:Regulatory protein E2 n=1 Tax=Mastomys coucha papillomavirus 2 TaxID=392505 RepID=Q06RH2_9PAPI|nr:E2 [Mastomys coucha papillomavirus 2]ABG56160.1 E2 [Mastomys coucha papillomavirus 2]